MLCRNHDPQTISKTLENSSNEMLRSRFKEVSHYEVALGFLNRHSVRVDDQAFFVYA